MRAIISFLSLLLLTICCWHCMAAKEKDKTPVAVQSSQSEEVSSNSNENSSNSEEASSKSEEDSSNAKEQSSNSVEDLSSESIDPTCMDKKKNHGETDIDCGGGYCAKCADGKKCKVDSDCINDLCKDKLCTQQPTKPTTQSIKTVTSTTTVPTTTTTPKPTTVPTTTTTPKPTTAPTTTTTPEPTTVPTTTTTPKPTTVPTTTTTPQPTTVPTTTTTPKPTTVPTTTTTPEPTTTHERTTRMPVCNPGCQNNGICIDDNVCVCTTGFSGPTCAVQSVGLCLNNETFNTEPILLITFGNGSTQYSTATPADFHFSTTYQQRFQPVTNDGMFSFINSVHNDFNGAWHTNATDHTGDNGGYMYLVNADLTPGQFYNGRIDNLCIGLRYEFSVYLANLCKPSGRINPNILFEVRSTNENILLAQLNSGDIVERNSLTWEKYGISFVAPSSSVNLLMISNARGGSGNDLVIDDIALHVCAYEGSGFCPSN